MQEFPRNHAIQALFEGDLVGKPFGPIPTKNMILAGSLYAVVALAALFIAV